MLVGIMDTSSALLLRGAKPGQLLNICGSTDVLALCTDHPKPSEHLLTRAVGVGRRWMQVSSIAAAGSALAWANRVLFSELPDEKFYLLIRKLARKPMESAVKFDPYLAGDRVSLEQKTASFTGLSLAHTREDLLGAIVASLTLASAQRLPFLQATGTPIHHDVLLSGGLARDLSGILHRDWPGKWKFTNIEEATLKGLGKLGNSSFAI
jgi:xylulokinase